MLVAFNKSIVRVYAREHGAAMAQRHPLAADDILPISLFELVRSNLRRLVLLQQMLVRAPALAQARRQRIGYFPNRRRRSGGTGGNA